MKNQIKQTNKQKYLTTVGNSVWHSPIFLRLRPCWQFIGNNFWKKFSNGHCIILWCCKVLLCNCWLVSFVSQIVSILISIEYSKCQACFVNHLLIGQFNTVWSVHAIKWCFLGLGPISFHAHQIRISVVFTHVRYFYLTHPYQPKGKIKNEQPHAGHTSIRDVIVMFKWRHLVASQPIQDFLEVFFKFLQYKWGILVVSKKKNPLFMWGWDRKICLLWSPIVITP